jgi:hypothetical protein
MDRKARYPFKWFSLITPLSVLLTMTLGTATLHASPIDGVKGSRDTTRKENILPPSVQTRFNYPTNGKPNPLFGAQPFTRQRVLFEEFGPEKLDAFMRQPGLTFGPQVAVKK